VGLDLQVIDIVHDASADLWLCRDVLAHLRNADAVAVLRNFIASDIPYLATKTYDLVTVNSDTRPGEFRYINLVSRAIRAAKAPFPAPPGYLRLWSRDDIKRALP
jgi:hypothetical protein